MIKLLCIHAAPPQPLNITMTAALTTASEFDVSIDGLLHWDIQEDSDTMHMDVLNTSYIITVTQESEELNQSISETSNTSTQLTLFLDQDYNISVTARNCVGTSEPAELVWEGE